MFPRSSYRVFRIHRIGIGWLSKVYWREVTVAGWRARGGHSDDFDLAIGKVSLAFATAHYVDRLILLLYSRARAVKHHNQQSQSSLIFRAADPPSNLECKEK